MRFDKGKPFTHIEADFPVEGRNVPVFSEAFLYETVGKGDARFILGVADEYEHLIEALGPKALRAILDVRPRLAQRLGVGEHVVEFLEDARSEESLRQEKELPSQIILDDQAAESVWRFLHDEYSRTFDPENDMDKDRLRMYNTLTDALGSHEQRQRQKERDRLPEKLERKADRESQLDGKRKRRIAALDAKDALQEFVNGGGAAEPDAILALLAEAWEVKPEA